MKKLISGFMAVVLALGLMTVPAFAANGNPTSEKWVYDGYITGCGAMESVYNDKVLPMSEAPVMDYTKTIGPVTFSNFVSYDERDSKDANRNPIHMYRVTIGIDGCMRVNEDNCDIMYFAETTFNDINLVAQDWYKFNNKSMAVDSDYNSIKTLTPMVKGWHDANVAYRTERYNIQAYAGKQNYGGTWPEGLTWQFGAQYDCYRSSGDYFATYPISVKVGEETYYYFVTVKDKQTYTGDRAAGTTPVETKPIETPVVSAPTYELKSFSDVSSDRWSHKAIMDMVALGLFSGTTAPNAEGVGTFAPTATMTRAQFITVVTRYLYNDELNTMAPASVWYENNYNLAREKGLIPKYLFGLEEMNAPMTREEMAMVLVNALAAKGVTVAEEDWVSPDAIADYETVDGYYKYSVRQAFTLGVLAGTDSKGTFLPRNSLTREQGAVVISRLVEKANG